MSKIYLVTEDGAVFEGYSFGASVESCGELVFNTGMVGYIESLTDPAYYGQILLQTFPLVGNYGIIPEDFEGKCHLSGLVVHEWCDTPSNFRSEYDLDKFLKDNGIPGIYGVDTREITKHIRENGTLKAKICKNAPADLSEITDYAIKDAVTSVTCVEEHVYSALGVQQYRVTVVDYGVKKSIIQQMQQRGCAVKVVPADTTATDILADHPDGVLLSGGPGDPSDNGYRVEQIKNLIDKVPIFAIGLGHQLLALADGGATYKLKYGHRGANQPSGRVGTNRTYITVQNNGYAVVSGSTEHGVDIFLNANDGVCEGIEYPLMRAFSVQFYPESIDGPHSTAFLYDKFIELMGGE